MAVVPIAVRTGVVIAAVTAVVVAVGAAVVDATAEVDLRAQAWAAAICLLRNTLRRKASLAETTRAATTTAAAISGARKIAAASRVVLSLVVLPNAALIIARPKQPVPPHPALPRKNPFFSRANPSPSIVASPQSRLRHQWPRRKFVSRNPISKTRHLALPVTWALPFLPPDPPAAMFPAVSPADFPAGYSPTLAPNRRLLPSPRTKISALRKTLPSRLTARIRRGMKLHRSSCQQRLVQNLSLRAAKLN
jgi:hypothetical protein